MNRNPVVIELNAQALVSVEEGRGARVYCLQGTLWITEERLPKDVVLEAGETYELAGAGRAVIQAMSASRVAVESPEGKPQLAFPAAQPELRLAA